MISCVILKQYWFEKNNLGFLEIGSGDDHLNLVLTLRINLPHIFTYCEQIFNSQHLCCLPLTSCVVSRFFPGTQELGELYSLACDTDHFVTGHTLNTSAFKVFRTEDFEEVKIIKVKQYIIE